MADFLVDLTLTRRQVTSAEENWWWEPGGAPASILRQDAAGDIRIIAYNYGPPSPLRVAYIEVSRFTAEIEAGAEDVVLETTDGTELLRFPFPAYDAGSRGYTSPDQTAAAMSVFQPYRGDLVFRVTAATKDVEIGATGEIDAAGSAELSQTLQIAVGATGEIDADGTAQITSPVPDPVHVGATSEVDAAGDLQLTQGLFIEATGDVDAGGTVATISTTEPDDVAIGATGDLAATVTLGTIELQQAPRFRFALTNRRGTEIRLVFRGTLDSTSTPAPSAFTVTPSRTVSAVRVTTREVVLTMATLFTHTDVVTVAYAKPAANPLQGLDDTSVDSFAAVSVANTVADPDDDILDITLTTRQFNSVEESWWFDTGVVPANLIRQDTDGDARFIAQNYTGTSPLYGVFIEMQQFTLAIELLRPDVWIEGSDGTPLFEFPLPGYIGEGGVRGYSFATTPAVARRITTYQGDIVVRIPAPIPDVHVGGTGEIDGGTGEIEERAGDLWMAGRLSNLLYKSTDGGATWGTRVDPPAGQNISDVAVDPRNGDVWLAVALPRGLYKSTDGGANWGSLIAPPDGQTFVTGVDIDPRNGDLWLSGATPDGIYKSTDGGATWGSLISPPDGLTGVTSVAIDPRNGDVWICGSNPIGLYKSTDGGTTWGSRIPPASGVTSIQGVAIDLRNGDLWTASANPRGLYKSTDGGANWGSLIATPIGQRLPVGVAIDAGAAGELTQILPVYTGATGEVDAAGDVETLAQILPVYTGATGDLDAGGEVTTLATIDPVYTGATGEVDAGGEVEEIRSGLFVSATGDVDAAGTVTTLATLDPDRIPLGATGDIDADGGVERLAQVIEKTAYISVSNIHDINEVKLDASLHLFRFIAGHPFPSDQEAIFRVQGPAGSDYSVIQWAAVDDAGDTVTLDTIENRDGTTDHQRRKLTVQNFGSAQSVRVTARRGVRLYDTETVQRLEQGTGTLVVSFTNDVITLPADEGGVVTDYSGATGELRLYIGLLNVPTSDYNVVATVDPGVTFDYDHATRVYAVTGITDAVRSGQVRFDVTYNRIVYVHRITILKAGVPRDPGFFAQHGFTGTAFDTDAADALTPGANVVGDVVTFVKADQTWFTRTWDGSAWVGALSLIPGGVVVTRSLTAERFQANTITARQVSNAAGIVKAMIVERADDEIVGDPTNPIQAQGDRFVGIEADSATVKLMVQPFRHYTTTGDDGIPGLNVTEPGPPGQDGLDGAAGVFGLPGNPGPQGADGPAGDQGAQGIAGPIGGRGQAGGRGGDGPPGGPGLRGLDGSPGLRGFTGGPGPRGLSGGTGGRGATGIPGPPGPAGSDGEPGARAAGAPVINSATGSAAYRDRGGSSTHPFRYDLTVNWTITTGGSGDDHDNMIGLGLEVRGLSVTGVGTLYGTSNPSRTTQGRTTGSFSVVVLTTSRTSARHTFALVAWVRYAESAKSQSASRQVSFTTS